MVIQFSGSVNRFDHVTVTINERVINTLTVGPFDALLSFESRVHLMDFRSLKCQREVMCDKRRDIMD